MATTTAPAREIIVPARFNGPPASGNGGYTAGLMAEQLGGSVEVMLAAPPPLDRPMRLDRDAAGLVAMVGTDTIARAQPATLDVDIVPAPSWDDAVAMSRCYTGFRAHAFPTCFVCGPARAVGDGLRIFAGRRDTDACVAAPWTADESLAGTDGLVPARFVWAALDCPGYFAVAAAGEAAVLGRMTAVVHRVPRVGERCVVAGRSLGQERRKRFAATALHGDDGAVIAAARQVWVVLPTPAAPA